MAAITGAELQCDRFISADPVNGVLATLDSASAAVNLVTYSLVEGDVTHSAPTGSAAGGGTRTHRFDRPIVSTAAGTFTTMTLSGALTGATTGAFSGNLTVGGTAVVTGAITATTSLFIGDTTRWVDKSGTSLVLGAGTATRLTLPEGGQILVGPTVATGAAAGEVVVAQGKAYRSANAAETTTYPLISLSSDSWTQLGVSTGRVVATTPANFSANGYIRLKDESGTLVYIPAMTAGW